MVVGGKVETEKTEKPRAEEEDECHRIPAPVLEGKSVICNILLSLLLFLFRVVGVVVVVVALVVVVVEGGWLRSAPLMTSMVVVVEVIFPVMNHIIFLFSNHNVHCQVLSFPYLRIRVLLHFRSFNKVY